MKPLRTKAQGKQQIAQPFNMPAPTNGWYVGDSQADPPPKTAIVMNNAFPELDYVRLRGGSAAYASGMGNFPVQSIMPWTNGVTFKMFAVCNGKIYDVSAAGAVGSAAVTGLASSYLEYVQFEGLGGSYLVAVDGADPVQIYDGTGWNRTWSYTGTLAENIQISGSATAGVAAITGMSTTANLVVGVPVVNSTFPAGTEVVAIGPGLQVTTSQPALTTAGGTFEFGAAVISSISSVANLQVGMALSGTGINPGTSIAGIFGSTVVLNEVATATGSETFTFYQNAPITGYSGAGFSNVCTYKGALYFVDGVTTNCYYLGLNNIGGPASLLPLGPYFSKGGSLLAMATWALDSMVGQFAVLVFISTMGEVLMFSGASPIDPAWTILGTYKCAQPVGRRCLIPAGGDLLIMTIDGIVALSKVMTLDQVALENVAITKPIAPAWQTAVIARQGIVGWQIVAWPIMHMEIINLPKVNSTDYTQFVANSRSGAWAQYLGWDANCFVVSNDLMYYGDSLGNVWQGETGGCDQGLNSYTTTIMMAYSGLGVGSVGKQIRLVKPYIQAITLISPQITINVEYDVTIPPPPSPSSTFAGALWDSAVWDSSVWGGALIPQNSWLNAEGYGAAISIVFQTTTSQGETFPDVRIAAFDVLFEKGSIFG
jgi:hypothetical protein